MNPDFYFPQVQKNISNKKGTQRMLIKLHIWFQLIKWFLNSILFFYIIVHYVLLCYLKRLYIPFLLIHLQEVFNLLVFLFPLKYPVFYSTLLRVAKTIQIFGYSFPYLRKYINLLEKTRYDAFKKKCRPSYLNLDTKLFKFMQILNSFNIANNLPQ